MTFVLRLWLCINAVKLIDQWVVTNNLKLVCTRKTNITRQKKKQITAPLHWIQFSASCCLFCSGAICGCHRAFFAEKLFLFYATLLYAFTLLSSGCNCRLAIPFSAFVTTRFCVYSETEYYFRRYAQQRYIVLLRYQGEPECRVLSPK